MTPRAPGTGLAIAAALAMIAFQVAAKATRDALFLSSFPASSLPVMTAAAATVAVIMAIAGAKLLARFGPSRVIPLGFAGSALLLVGEWLALHVWLKPSVVAVYLHYGALGGLLVSGFWATLSERFDPRTAKRALGRVAAGGTVGGLVGGIVADRVGSAFTVDTMLPVLALFHGVCAVLVWRFQSAPSAPVSPTASRSGSSRLAPTLPRAQEPETRESGLAVFRRSPYIRTFVVLVVLVTMSEVLVDWLFKARAAGAMVRGESLLRLFGAFYMGVSLLTVVVQALFSRLALERLGLARSVATLPAAVGIGSVGALAWPGLPSALALRAGESVLSNSLYRGAYEVLFNPVPAGEKRAVKTVVDVGAARAGDFVGALLVQAALLTVGMSLAPTAILLIALLVSGVTLVVAYRMHAGYVRALERGLESRAVHLELSEVGDVTTRSTILQTIGAMDLSQTLARPRFAGPESTPAVPSSDATDPVARRGAALASGRISEVRAALREGPIAPELLPRAIALLAWDEAARDAIDALRQAGHDSIPLLAGALVNPESDFAVRRRLPLVLGTFANAAAVEALLGGLADKRFEVRYRSGRALHHLVTTHSRLGVPPDRVYEAVMREVGTERRVWEGQRLLDQLDDESWAPAFDEALRARANRSLEHVFTLLSLALPRQPVQIAFRGLHTDDALLRGTALEYLETTLPSEVRKAIWPYLEDTRPKRAKNRSVEAVLADLLQSNQSIAIRLDELRRLETPAPETPSSESEQLAVRQEPPPLPPVEP